MVSSDDASIVVAQIADGLDHAGPNTASIDVPDTAARAQLARRCKLCIELDRCEAMRALGYRVALLRALQADRMPKADVLVGLPPAARRPEWHKAAATLQLLA